MTGHFRVDPVCAGGIALIPLDVAYALFARAPDAVRRGYSAKGQTGKDLMIDFVTSTYENPEGRSSTIIDCGNMRLLRHGVCGDALLRVLRSQFGVTPAQRGNQSIN